MASPQIENIANSALLKVLSYVVTGFVLPALLVLGIRLIDRLDHLESMMNTQRSDYLLMQSDVQSLKGLSSVRGETLANQHDQIMALRFDMNAVLQKKTP